MSTTGYSRGHPVRFDEPTRQWRYADTDEPLGSCPPRPCVKCGEVFDAGEPDACLGVLPGVDNACCGHGVPSEAYVRFTSHVMLTGFTKKPCCGAEGENTLGVNE